MRQILKKLILLSIILNITTFVYSQDNREKARECYLKGNVYYQQGRYKEAQEEFQKALDLLSIVPPPPEAKPIEEKKTQVEYVIGEEDVLHISIWQNPDLDTEAIVRPDGKISFPLIGDVQVTGLTITQLDQVITEGLKEYIKYPEVSISIKKLGGKKVIVLGEVVNPGVYSVTGAKTVLEAIGLAGGFTKDAVPSSTVIIRGGFDDPEAKRINLTKAVRGDVRQNIALQSEDIVFIPKRFIANLNYFLSQVLDPISKGVYTAKEIERW